VAVMILDNDTTLYRKDLLHPCSLFFTGEKLQYKTYFMVLFKAI